MGDHIVFVEFNILDYLLLAVEALAVVSITIYTWYLNRSKHYHFIAFERSNRVFYQSTLLVLLLVILRLLVYKPKLFIDGDSSIFILAMHIGILITAFWASCEIVTNFVRKIYLDSQDIIREKHKSLIYSFLIGLSIIAFAFIYTGIYVISNILSKPTVTLFRFNDPYPIVISAFLLIVLPIVNVLRIYPLHECAVIYSNDSKEKLRKFFNNIGILTKEIMTNKHNILRLWGPVTNADDIILNIRKYLNLEDNRTILSTGSIIIDPDTLSNYISNKIEQAKNDLDKIIKIMNEIFLITDKLGITNIHELKMIIMTLLNRGRK